MLTVVLLRAESLVLGRRGYCGGRRQGRARRAWSRSAGWKWVALAVMLHRAAATRCSCLTRALLNAAFSPVATQFVSFGTLTLHNIEFVFFELSATRLALKNTLILGTAAATIGTVMAVVIAYITARQADRVAQRSASSPPRRSPFPASCSASACS